MKSVQLIFTITIALCLSACFSNIKNSKTETHKVWGNCNMCKKTIEKAVNISGESSGNWNKDSKMIVLTFDSTKTNFDKILKRIAEAGYDNELFTGSQKSYDYLPECCQYDRKKQ
jgi:copper chaperone CopZ